MDQTLRVCTRCHSEYPATLEFFGPNADQKYGLMSWCRPCSRAYKSGNWAANREHRRATARASYQRQRERIFVHAWAKSLAKRFRRANLYGAGKRRVYEVDQENPIDASFILELFDRQGGRCYWTGVPMVPTASSRRLLKPSLDRVDSALGYLRSNVVLVCLGVNFCKNGASVQEFREFLALIKANEPTDGRAKGALEGVGPAGPDPESEAADVP